VAVVRNTWSFQMTGEDQPSPGMVAFHNTFEEADHSRGIFVSVE
jgi:hypothetical protein